MSKERIVYGVGVDWNSLPKYTETISDLPDDISSLCFQRVKNNCRGIQRFRNLRCLVAVGINQQCLDELVTLPNLEMLYLDKGFSATDLTPLGQCRSLRRLILMGGTKITTLDWVQNLPQLESLLIENFKLVRDISPLTSLRKIRAIGIEGGILKMQNVNTFQPLGELSQLEAVFITNCRAERDGLKPFQNLRQLKILEAPGFYSEADFLALRATLPKLKCHWFELIDRYGSIKKAIKAMAGKTK